MLCLKLQSVLQGKDWQIQTWVLKQFKAVAFSLVISLVDKLLGIQLATIRIASSVQPNQDMRGNLSNPSKSKFNYTSIDPKQNGPT